MADRLTILKHRIPLIIIGLTWVCLIVVAVLHRDAFTQENVMRLVSGNPAFAVGILMLLFLLKSLTVVFYSGVLYAVSGILFPLPAAIALNICGNLLMVLVPYYLGKRLGSEDAERLREKHPRLQSVEDLRLVIGATAFTALLRGIKLVNFDVGSAYLGATGTNLRAVLIGSPLGMLAEIVLFPVIGANLGDPRSFAFWGAIALDLLICGAALLVSKRIKNKQKEN